MNIPPDKAPPPPPPRNESILDRLRGVVDGATFEALSQLPSSQWQIVVDAIVQTTARSGAAPVVAGVVSSTTTASTTAASASPRLATTSSPLSSSRRLPFGNLSSSPRINNNSNSSKSSSNTTTPLASRRLHLAPLSQRQSIQIPAAADATSPSQSSSKSHSPFSSKSPLLAQLSFVANSGSPTHQRYAAVLAAERESITHQPFSLPGSASSSSHTQPKHRNLSTMASTATDAAAAAAATFSTRQSVLAATLNMTTVTTTALQRQGQASLVPTTTTTAPFQYGGMPNSNPNGILPRPFVNAALATTSTVAATASSSPITIKTSPTLHQHTGYYRVVMKLFDDATTTTHPFMCSPIQIAASSGTATASSMAAIQNQESATQLSSPTPPFRIDPFRIFKQEPGDTDYYYNGYCHSSMDLGMEHEGQKSSPHNDNNSQQQHAFENEQDDGAVGAGTDASSMKPRTVSVPSAHAMPMGVELSAVDDTATSTSTVAAIDVHATTAATTTTGPYDNAMAGLTASTTAITTTTTQEQAVSRSLSLSAVEQRANDNQLDHGLLHPFPSSSQSSSKSHGNGNDPTAGSATAECCHKSRKRGAAVDERESPQLGLSRPKMPRSSSSSSPMLDRSTVVVGKSDSGSVGSHSGTSTEHQSLHSSSSHESPIDLRLGSQVDGPSNLQFA